LIPFEDHVAGINALLSDINNMWYTILENVFNFIKSNIYSSNKTHPIYNQFFNFGFSLLDNFKRVPQSRGWFLISILNLYFFSH
jgi:hypothetical protein